MHIKKILDVTEDICPGIYHLTNTWMDFDLHIFMSTRSSTIAILPKMR
jgi:hypothetical protein